MNRTCSNCGCEKNGSEFYYKKTEERFNSWCKACLYEFQRKRWISRKIKAVEMMGNKCCRCGYDKNIAVLDFHHVNPNTKEMSWTKLRLQKWSRIVEELKKCILVCSNCHGEIHYPHCGKNNRDDENSNNFLDKETIVLNPTGKCPICKKDVYSTKYCSVICANLGTRKVKRPSSDILREEIENNSWLALSRKYGVSDNAVRKWAKQYNLI